MQPYTAAGELATVDNTGTPNLPDVVLTNTYDGIGELSLLGVSVAGTTQFTNGYTYDNDGDVTGVNQSGGAISGKSVTFGYNALGQLTTIGFYGGVSGTTQILSGTYGYNQGNQLTSLAYNNSGGTTLASYGYTYNSDGEITGLTDNDGSTAYTYDADGRLTGASGTALEDLAVPEARADQAGRAVPMVEAAVAAMPSPDSSTGLVPGMTNGVRKKPLIKIKPNEFAASVDLEAAGLGKFVPTTPADIVNIDPNGILPSGTSIDLVNANLPVEGWEC